MAEKKPLTHAETLAEIERLLKLGYTKEDIVILPDGRVIAFFQEEFKGVAQAIDKLEEQKDST